MSPFYVLLLELGYLVTLKTFGRRTDVCSISPRENKLQLSIMVISLQRLVGGWKHVGNVQLSNLCDGAGASLRPVLSARLLLLNHYLNIKCVLPSTELGSRGQPSSVSHFVPAPLQTGCGVHHNSVRLSGCLWCWRLKWPLRADLNCFCYEHVAGVPVSNGALPPEDLASCCSSM